MLEKEPEDFSSKMFPSCFFVIHNPTGRRQYNITEIEYKKDKSHYCQIEVY